MMAAVAPTVFPYARCKAMNPHRGWLPLRQMAIAEIFLALHKRCRKPPALDENRRYLARSNSLITPAQLEYQLSTGISS